MKNAAGVPSTSIGYRPQPLGGLGYDTGVEWASDGSYQLVKTDGAGGWRRDRDALVWEQVMRKDTIPSELHYFTPSLGTSTGLWEAKIAPSDPLVVMASYQHRWLRSADGARTWELCPGIPQGGRMSSNASGGPSTNNSYQRLTFNKAAFDPVNEDVFYWAPENSRLHYTLDRGDTFDTILDIPIPSYAAFAGMYQNVANLYMLIAIDHTSPTINGRKSVFYVQSIGNGIYRVDDGVVTKISDTLLYAANMQVRDDGQLWVFNYGTSAGNVSGPNIYTYTHGVGWTGPFGTYTRTVLWDPSDATFQTMVRLSSVGPFRRSEDGGVTWLDNVGTASDPFNSYAEPHLAPLLANLYNEPVSISYSQMALDPLEENRVAIGSGYGMFEIELDNWLASNKTTGPALVLHEDTAGIENIVPQYGLITPNGVGYMNNQDKAMIVTTFNGAFPQTAYPTGLKAGYNCDYAAEDPAWVATVIGDQRYDSYTADNGRNWTQFWDDPADNPWNLDVDVEGEKSGGSICTIRKGHVVIFPGQDGIPHVITDYGATKTPCIFNGLPITNQGWNPGTTERDMAMVCNDKEGNPDLVWAYNKGQSGNAGAKGIWHSENGGFEFDNICNEFIIPDLVNDYNNHLKYRNGILWLCGGNTGATMDAPGTTLKLWRSTANGVTGSWQGMPGVIEPHFFDFGKNVNDDDYPALYVFGYSATAPYTRGLYRCLNPDAANINDCTWQKLTDTNSLISWSALAADPNIFGHLLLGYGGSGWEEAFDNDVARGT